MAKKCKCPIKGVGNERKCFNAWWGPGAGGCNCDCHVPKDLFDLAEGKRLAEDGAERALTHAEQASAGWRERAWGYLLEFLRICEGTFMAEDVRQYAYSRGFERPPDDRAWGGIMLRAAKQGIITRLGFGRSRAKNVHANPATVWRATTQEAAA